MRFNQSFRGEKIPTLEEAIEAARGKIQLNIEVKYNGHNPNLVRKVVRIIEEQEFAESKAESESNKGATQAAPASASNNDGFMNIPDGVDEELPFN